MAREAITHSRAVAPWFIPNKGGSADDFHGLTDLGGDPTVGTEDVFVIGKKNKCATDKDTPEVTAPFTQLERGEIQTYLTLANLDSEPSGGITLDDFSSSLVDVVYYVKEEFDGTLDSTVWMPKTAITSLSLDIGDPEARIERSFDLVGENRRILKGDSNKYFIHKQDTAPSGTSGSYDIDLSDPSPSVNPNVSGEYLLRVDRTRSGTTDTLTEGTDYTFNSGTDTLSITSANADDVYNIYYSASSFGTAGDPTSVDSADPCFLKAENVTVEINDGSNTVELGELSSLSLSATLNRIDELVVGKSERILREIEDTPVTLDVSGRVRDWEVEEAFMNSIDSSNMISNVKDFKDNVKVTIKIYETSDKNTFKIGYQVDNLTFSDGTISFTANEFGTADVSAESTDILITTTEGNL